MAGELKALLFAEGTAVSAATAAPSLSLSSFASHVSDAAYVTAKGSAAAAGDAYFNTTSLVVKEYDGTAWRTVVTATGAQVITEKDFDGGTASNTSRITVPKAAKATLDALTRKEGTLVYASDLDTLYADNGTTLSPVGAGSSGELNLIDNPNDAYASWTETGTVFNSGILTKVATDTSDLPLAGIIDTCIQITAGTGANPDSGVEASEYVSCSFTTPASLAAKLKVEFYMRPGTLFVASEWTVSVYAGATRQSLSTDASSVTYLPVASGKFTTTFDCAASTAYTLRFARIAGATAGAVLNIANVIVGPGIQPQGAVVGPEIAFTPTFTNIPVNDTVFTYQRIGQNMRVRGSANVTGAVTGSVSVALPTGFTLDTTNIQSQTLEDVFGEAYVFDVSASAYSRGGIKFLTTSTFRITAVDGGSSGTWSAAFPIAAWASGDKIILDFEVPIAEWAGSGTVNLAQNDLVYVAVNSTWGTTDTALTSLVYGEAGATATGSLAASFTKRVRGPAGSIPEVQLRNSLTGNWVDAAQMLPYTRQDAAEAGIQISSVAGSLTDYDVYFGRYLVLSGALFGAAGAAWTTSYSWRVRFSAPGQAVGFGAATATSSGLIAPYNAASLVHGGNYTPTAAGLTNLTAVTVNKCLYSRVGKIVTVSGSASYTVTTTAVDCSFTIPLPVVTATLGSNDVSGVTTFYRTATQHKDAGYVLAFGTSAYIGTEGLSQASGTGGGCIFTFQYEIQ